MSKMNNAWVNQSASVKNHAVLAPIDPNKDYSNGYKGNNANTVYNWYDDVDNIYVVNALTLFFIISGYLIYKESKFDFKNKIKSIAKTLLLPYLIFSFLISLSKAWVYNNSINLIEICTQIAYGQSSWFVATLILSESIFALVLWMSRENIIAIALSLIHI